MITLVHCLPFATFTNTLFDKRITVTHISWSVLLIAKKSVSKDKPNCWLQRNTPGNSEFASHKIHTADHALI